MVTNLSAMSLKDTCQKLNFDYFSRAVVPNRTLSPEELEYVENNFKESPDCKEFFEPLKQITEERDFQIIAYMYFLIQNGEYTGYYVGSFKNDFEKEILVGEKIKLRSYLLSKSGHFHLNSPYDYITLMKLGAFVIFVMDVFLWDDSYFGDEYWNLLHQRLHKVIHFYVHLYGDSE